MKRHLTVQKDKLQPQAFPFYYDFHQTLQLLLSRLPGRQAVKQISFCFLAFWSRQSRGDKGQTWNVTMHKKHINNFSVHTHFKDNAVIAQKIQKKGEEKKYRRKNIKKKNSLCCRNTFFCVFFYMVPKLKTIFKSIKQWSLEEIGNTLSLCITFFGHLLYSLCLEFMFYLIL